MCHSSWRSRQAGSADQSFPQPSGARSSLHAVQHFCCAVSTFSWRQLFDLSTSFRESVLRLEALLDGFRFRRVPPRV